MFMTNTMCGHCTRGRFTLTNQRLRPFFFAPCTEDLHVISYSMLIYMNSTTRGLRARSMPVCGRENNGLIGEM